MNDIVEAIVGMAGVFFALIENDIFYSIIPGETKLECTEMQVMMNTSSYLTSNFTNSSLNSTASNITNSSLNSEVSDFKNQTTNNTKNCSNVTGPLIKDRYV